MGTVAIVNGNIFTSQCQTLVNTVNCVGVMGAGVALEFRLRYPNMYDEYQNQCKQKNIRIGVLWVYRTGDRWILNFPTKQHWKHYSKIDYLHLGLSEFMNTYREQGITSIAFPLLGAQKGGLDPMESQKTMELYLRHCDIPVEIYRYYPHAPDDLYYHFKCRLESMTIEEIKWATKLRIDRIEVLLKAMSDPDIRSLSRLGSVKGVGIKTLEKAFQLGRNTSGQKMLFNDM